MAREVYKAGVYMVRSLRQGVTASYIGASLDLRFRLENHQATIVNGRKSGQVARAFAGHAIEELEFRILEFINVRIVDARRSSSIRMRCDPRIFNISGTRERFWIHRLKPTLNRQGRLPRINVSKLPVGARVRGEDRHATTQAHPPPHADAPSHADPAGQHDAAGRGPSASPPGRLPAGPRAP